MTTLIESLNDCKKTKPRKILSSLGFHSKKFKLNGQTGQILPLGFIMCAVALIAWTLSSEVGRLVHDKSSLLRATDAAVYSAAVTQAHALNLHAYLNRAQLAQQLAMAHLITMASAQRFRTTLAHQAGRFNPPVSLIGMLFGSQHAVAYFAAKAGGVDDRMMLRQLSEAFMQHDDVIHQVIDHVRGEQINRLKQQRRQVLEQVLVRNVGSSGSSMSGSSMIELGLEADFTLDELPGSISRFSSNDSHWQSTLRRVTDRYGFLSDRNYTKNNLWAVNLRCPLKRHELRRRGSTSIDPVGAWSARDDQSFHALRFNRVIGCYQREYPMGWALVDGTSRTETSEPIQKKFEIVTQNFSNESFWRWVGKQSDDRWNIFAGVDNRLARRWASLGEIRWTTKGAPTYAALTPKNKKSIGIAVAVKQRGSMIHAKGPMRNNAMGGRFALNTNERIQALQTESAAETYFSPPTAVSFHSPLPNLLQPFWKARLIDIADLKGQKSTDQPIAHRGETR